MTGSIPDSSTATHSATPTAKYTGARRTPAARMASTPAKIASATSSAVTWTWFVYTVAITSSATRSSTTTIESRNTRKRWMGSPRAVSASTPSAKAVSVDIAAPQPAALPQFAQIELPPRLEPHDEEEQRHQALVHPLAEVERDTRAAESYRELRCPDRLVRRVIDVGPGECEQRRREQEERAARLRP